MYEKDSPNWVPTVNMGHAPLPTTPSPQVASGRFERRKVRTEKTDAARTLLCLSEMDTYPVVDEPEPETGIATQTDIDSVAFDSMVNELSHLQAQNDEMKQKLITQVPYSSEFFTGNDEKVKFFTGLGSYVVLMSLFNYLENALPAKASLTKFQCLILTLMKLRLNLSNLFLSFHFNVSPSTVSRVFNDFVDVMYIRLKPLIHWPDREMLRKTMPMQFRKHFGKKCAVIIDCFEVFIETPSSVKSSCETWSSYKHHNTVKFLIGITPQGVISFISKSWGGRTSDKHVTEQSGFLDKILPGDLILADRGFNIESSVGTMSAQVKIPAFTKGKSQMSPIDLETTRKLANVRIHVERVIGLTRQKYTILNSSLPIEFLETKSKDDIPLIDKVAVISCALVNLCESIVSFD